MDTCHQKNEKYIEKCNGKIKCTINQSCLSHFQEVELELMNLINKESITEIELKILVTNSWIYFVQELKKIMPALIKFNSEHKIEIKIIADTKNLRCDIWSQFITVGSLKDDIQSIFNVSELKLTETDSELVSGEIFKPITLKYSIVALKNK